MFLLPTYIITSNNVALTSQLKSALVKLESPVYPMEIGIKVPELWLLSPFLGKSLLSFTLNNF